MYVFDADAFIQPYRTYYQPDIAPGFWQTLEGLIRTNTVKLTEPVYYEILPSNKKQNDWLSLWIFALRKYRIKVNNWKILKAFEKVTEFVENQYEPPHAREFLDVADPWVIAYAKAYDATIVSMESYKKEEIDPNTGLIRGTVKLPNVAEYFGLRVIKVYDFVKDLSIRLV